MPNQVTCACPNCRKSIAVPAEIAPGEPLCCPHCQQIFPWSTEEAATLPPIGAESLAEKATVPPKATPQVEAVTPPPRAPSGAGQAQVGTISHVKASSLSAGPGSPRSAPLDVVIPGYEILGELGRGGMGVVYKARHTKLGRLVALKMILAGGHAGESELARFRTEAEAIARLQHPNIIQIHEIGEHEGKPFFSLEYCSGGSLSQKINGTPLQPREAAQIMETLARAMHAAHTQGIIHRDLKPANVLLLKDGTPKITDFGLAKKLDDVGQTQSGAIMGTPSYMPPEQAAGKTKELGPAADIYALGAMLYELLTGRPPFKAATALDTIMQVVSNEPVPPSQLQSKVPADLETICLKCLHKEPAKRYASAQGMADDLRRFLNGEPITARPVGIAERAWRWCKRKPALASMIAALAAVIVIAFAVVLWQLHETTTAQRQRALAQVNALRDAAPGGVPGILADLETNRATVLPHLRTRFAEESDRGKRMRLALALLPIEPEKTRDELVAWMLQTKDPAETLLVRDALRPHSADLTGNLWHQADDPTRPRAERFRALVALASFDPASPRWKDVAPEVAEELLTANALHLGSWVQALHPVRLSLLSPLGEVFRGERLPEHRQVAAVVLADYAADRPEVLADLLMDADEKQFAVIYPKFKEQGERGLPVLTGEIEKRLPPELPSSDERREKLAKRQANAAVALIKMDRPEKVWPLLKHSPDPRVRSYLIHRFGSLGADAGAIVKRLDEERDVTIRRALILSLGEFAEKDWSADDRSVVTKNLQEIYRTAADPGVHAAAEWLLRSWKQEAWLKQVNDEWTKDQDQREKKIEGIKQTLAKKKEKTPQWYVNGQGQTMVVIPGSVEFIMGSPPTEAGRFEYEPQHKRRIARTFAVAAKSVTVEQYRQFDKGYTFTERYAPPPDCPVVSTSWYQATAYCNWLSKEEGIDPKEWCYEIKGQVTALRENYLSLSGYRLPTEAEMEFATRAGAVTSRYYGETEELLGKYGWYLPNAGDRSWPVGSKKPNDLGFFDMHGNVWCWCQNRYLNYPTGMGEDKEETLEIKSTDSLVLRGGSWLDRASNVRSAVRSYNAATLRVVFIGFRPARTLPLDGFTALPRRGRKMR